MKKVDKKAGLSMNKDSFLSALTKDVREHVASHLPKKLEIYFNTKINKVNFLNKFLITPDLDGFEDFKASLPAARKFMEEHESHISTREYEYRISSLKLNDDLSIALDYFVTHLLSGKIFTAYTKISNDGCRVRSVRCLH